MTGRERKRPAHDLSPRQSPGLCDLGQRTQRTVFQEMTQMAEGILVRHQIDSQLRATGGKLRNVLTGNSPPLAPDRFVLGIGERMFDVELKLIDLPVSEILDQFEE